MQSVTLKHVKYYYGGFIYGVAWGGFKGTYPIHGYKDTIDGINSLSLSMLNTGDFERILGARLSIYNVFEDDYKRYEYSITLGNIPESVLAENDD